MSNWLKLAGGKQIKNYKFINWVLFFMPNTSTQILFCMVIMRVPVQLWGQISYGHPTQKVGKSQKFHVLVIWRIKGDKM